MCGGVAAVGFVIIVIWNGKINVKEKRAEILDFIRPTYRFRFLRCLLLRETKGLVDVTPHSSVTTYQQQMTSYIEGGECENETRIYKNSIDPHG